MQRFCCVFRRLLALVSDKVERGDALTSDKVERRRRLLEIIEHNKHAKVLLCLCESSVKERKLNRINNERKRGERAKRIKKNNKKLVLIIINAYFCTRIKNKS